MRKERIMQVTSFPLQQREQPRAIQRDDIRCQPVYLSHPLSPLVWTSKEGHVGIEDHILGDESGFSAFKICDKDQQPQ